MALGHRRMLIHRRHAYYDVPVCQAPPIAVCDVVTNCVCCAAWKPATQDGVHHFIDIYPRTLHQGTWFSYNNKTLLATKSMVHVGFRIYPDGSMWLVEHNGTLWPMDLEPP